MTVLRLGNGSEFQTVRAYLDIVGRNAFSLVAAGAVVSPQTQLLISLLSEHGDEVNISQMEKLLLRLGDELGAAQQAAGVTAEDFQRVEVECATTAGRAEVERRVDAAQKKMFDVLQQPSDRTSVSEGVLSKGSNATTKATATTSTGLSSGVGSDGLVSRAGSGACGAAQTLYWVRSKATATGASGAITSTRRVVP